MDIENVDGKSVDMDKKYINKKCGHGHQSWTLTLKH